jgi:hypothetical protein
MGAVKVTAILIDDTHDDADLVSIVRRALLDAGCNVDSVDAVGVPQDSVLYIIEAGTTRFVEALPSRTNEVVWTGDIDRAKVCHGPASLQDCQREIYQRLGRFLAVRNV